MLTIEHRPKNILQYIIFLQRQTVMLSLTKPWQWQTLNSNNVLVWSAWTGLPAPAHKLALAGTPASLALLLYRKKYQTHNLGGPWTR